jgi:hypothetical protein
MTQHAHRLRLASDLVQVFRLVFLEIQNLHRDDFVVRRASRSPHLRRAPTPSLARQSRVRLASSRARRLARRRRVASRRVVRLARTVALTPCPISSSSSYADAFVGYADGAPGASLAPSLASLAMARVARVDRPRARREVRRREARRRRRCRARADARPRRRRRARARGDARERAVVERRASRARADDDDDDDDGRMREDELRAAIDEAREILAEAARMANEQARAELARTFDAGDGRGAAFECVRVEEFLKGKGARTLDAERAARELYIGDAYFQDVEKLMVQFDRLERALGGVPGMNVGALVGRCTEVATCDIARATANLLTLRGAFKVGKISAMVMDCPKLLMCDDLEDRIRRTQACITRIWASESDEDTIYAISEEPNLLFTLCDLPIFAEDISVDISELPMSVQGACVVVARARVRRRTAFVSNHSSRVEALVFATRRFKA